MLHNELEHPSIMNEIERKFLVKIMPDISDIVPLYSERYFLKGEAGIEERISKSQDRFFYERKEVLSPIERSREKKEITEEEFNSLKTRAYGSTIRETYLLSEKPKITLQIYQGRFKGLVRVEVEFDSVEEAELFKPMPWLGREITGLSIARDSTMLQLTQEEFLSSLHD